MFLYQSMQHQEEEYPSFVNVFFLIFQNKYNIGRKGRNKAEYEKSSSHILILILMCKFAFQAYLRLHGLLQGPPLKSQDVLKEHFKNFLNACSRFNIH